MSADAGLIPGAEARRIILSGLAPLRPRRAAISQVSGHVLAEAVRAAEAVPGFANSAMDGYALKAADTVRTPVVPSLGGSHCAGPGGR